MSNLAEKLDVPPVITRCLRVELVKPLNCSWDDAGQLLRAQRAIMHRLMNAAVLGYLDDRNLGKGNKPEASVYMRVSEALDGYRDWAAKHPDKQVRERASVDVGTGILSAIARIGSDAFQKWKKSKGNERIPSFGKGQPIPVREQESRIKRDKKGFVLECKLKSGLGEWHRFALAPSSGKHHEFLRNIAEKKDGFEQGAIKIDYDERRKKWYGLISYSYPKPPPAKECDPDRVMVLHRGVHNFLVAASSAGHWNVVARGGKLLALKRKLAARRRSMAAVASSELGQGAKGHGTERRYEAREAVGDLEARCIKTFCQQTAAKVRVLARQWGCGRIVIGDYGGIDPDEERALRRFVPRFPLYQLKSAIANALEPLSVELEEVSESYVSQTCPRCGTCDAIHNRRTGIFHCNICQFGGFSRPADWVSAILMLRRAEPVTNEHDRRLEQSYELERKLHGLRLDEQKAASENEAEESGDSTPQTRGHERSRTDAAKAKSDLLGDSTREVHDPPLRSRSQPSARAGERSGGKALEKPKTPAKRMGKTRAKGGARKPGGK